MSEKETGRPEMSAILSGGAALVTVFGWAGITPESVGQSTYDALFVAWPILVAGFAFLAGWNVRKLLTTRELGEKDARIRELEASAAKDAERIKELETERDGLRARLAEHEDVEAREAERRRRRLDGIAEEIKGLHANVKLVILALYDEGPIRDLHFHDFGGAASFLSDYADGEEVPPGNVIFTLRPETREALDAHPEALARVRERIEADPRLRLPLEPDGSPGMENVLKVSDSYTLTRGELSTPAISKGGRIVPAPARTEQAS